MKFMLLCQMNPADLAKGSPEDELAMMGAMTSYHHQLIQAGVLLGAGQLDDPRSGQRVFSEKGRIKTSEGPGLPGPLQIGGYYLIDVSGEPEATGWAAKCPMAQAGSIQVRQVIYSPL
jgi:hypothetical protein